MFDTLVNFDRNLFLILNDLHSPMLDSVMWWIADRFIWIPLYVLIAVTLYRKFGFQSVYMILFGGLLIVLSDQSSVLIKNNVERLRPCHDETISLMVHLVKNKCGGQFGFVSSHAANTMALLTYFLLLTRNSVRWMTYTLVVWVMLIGYCRIYMGVHFPADVIGGWIVGVLSAGITYVLYRLRFDSPQSQLK